jgi:hypothetical protein
MYERIKSDMAEVQSLYENHDSIIVCPVFGGYAALHEGDREVHQYGYHIAQQKNTFVLLKNRWPKVADDLIML